MKPPFGTLNATLAKVIIASAPRYTKIVEPFADGGTLALVLAKRKPKEHIVNIVNLELFAAFQFVQTIKSADKRRLKSFDWIASQETFDEVVRISATEGADAFYKFFYLKKFGMRENPKDKESAIIFDVFRTGNDIFPALYGLPLMTVGLKKVTLINEEPLTVMAKGGGAFMVLLPKVPDDVTAVQSRLKSGSSGNVFFAAKKKTGADVIETATSLTNYNVTSVSVASIMMGTMAVVTNYEAKNLKPIDTSVDDLGLSSESKSWRERDLNVHAKLLGWRDEQDQFLRWLGNRKGYEIDCDNFSSKYLSLADKREIYQQWQNDEEINGLIDQYADVIEKLNVQKV